MLYTVEIEIPELEALREEVQILKQKVDGARTLKAGKQWFCLKELAEISGISYTKFLHSPYLWPEQSEKPAGKRIMFSREAVATWVEKNSKIIRGLHG